MNNTIDRSEPIIFDADTGAYICPECGRLFFDELGCCPDCGCEFAWENQ